MNYDEGKVDFSISTVLVHFAHHSDQLCPLCNQKEAPKTSIVASTERKVNLHFNHEKNNLEKIFRKRGKGCPAKLLIIK